MRVRLVAAFCVLACVAQAEAQPPRPASRDKGVVGKGPSDPAPKLGETKFNGKTLSQWRMDLKSEDASKRALALLAIPNFGEEAKVAVLDVVARLRDDDLSPRAKACLALRIMGIEGKDMPAVVKALGKQVRVDPQGIIRYEAALTLRTFGNDAFEAIPDLIVGMKDPSSWEIRHMCVATLWRAAVDSKNGPDERAVKAMVQRLYARGAAYQEKLELVIGLGSVGRPANAALHKEVVDVLDLCTKTTRGPRSIALWAYAGLVNQGDTAKADDALLKLGKFTKDTDIEIRIQAIGALGALGKRASKRIPDLLALLSDPDAVVISAAASSLANIGSKDDDKIVSALISVMTRNEKDPFKAAAGVIGLVNLKADHKHVLEAMDRMRENKDLDIRLRGLIEKGQKTLKEPKKDKK